eukprot:15151043-Alexandrium_andersonii.AAC.1
MPGSPQYAGRARATKRALSGKTVGRVSRARVNCTQAPGAAMGSFLMALAALVTPTDGAYAL